MSGVSVVRSPSNAKGNLNVTKDEGRFTFLNGDTYTGGFILDRDKRFVTRHGHGLYLTEDFNEYEAYWSEDRIVGEARIRYNNGTRYRGTLGVDGGMVGSGSYTFAANSVLRATWYRNEPVADVTMKGPPAEAVWEGVSVGKELALTATNHFWYAIGGPTGNERKKGRETHLDVGMDR